MEVCSSLAQNFKNWPPSKNVKMKPIFNISSITDNMTSQLKARVLICIVLIFFFCNKHFRAEPDQLILLVAHFLSSIS